MDLKKVSVFSTLICLGGVLSEIIFHDVLVRTVPGIAICIVVAAVVIVSGYFAVDTAFSYMQLLRERELDRQQEAEQEVYHILNDQVEVQKAIYGDMKKLHDKIDSMEITNSMYNIDTAKPLSEEEHQQITKEINDYTVKTAKVVLKYVEKGMNDLKKSIEEIKEK